MKREEWDVYHLRKHMADLLDFRETEKLPSFSGCLLRIEEVSSQKCTKLACAWGASDRTDGHAFCSPPMTPPIFRNTLKGKGWGAFFIFLTFPPLSNFFLFLLPFLHSFLSAGLLKSTPIIVYVNSFLNVSLIFFIKGVSPRLSVVLCTTVVYCSLWCL